uniref:LRAT domain-containing protein n=1 Tax=Leptobrachium leishanense TaxID=445787 RepID=A0A8C5WM11_9ANUR
TTPTLPSEALIFLQGEYPNPGDLIEFQRVGYQHWAIFVGDKDVVHLTSRKYLDGKSSKSPMITREALVKKDPLNVVAGKSNFRVNNKYDEKETPLPTQKVVKAALENVGQTVNYNITTNNCEHFVTKLKYETAVSDQRAGNSPNAGELPAHTVPVRCLFEGSEIPMKKHCFGYSENTNQQ